MSIAYSTHDHLFCFLAFLS